jgi:hypothetical protein
MKMSKLMKNVFMIKMEMKFFVSISNGYVNHIAGREIIQLKNNITPKGIVPLEKFFDDNDVAKNPRNSK